MDGGIFFGTNFLNLKVVTLPDIHFINKPTVKLRKYYPRQTSQNNLIYKFRNSQTNFVYETLQILFAIIPSVSYSGSMC